MLKKLKGEGISILVSTPYMDEASMCDRIALIQDGAFMTIDTPENIVAQFEHELWAVQGAEMYRILKDLRANNEVRSSFAFGDTHHITVDSMSQDELKQYLSAKGHSDIKIEKIKAGIEDCFMELSPST